MLLPSNVEPRATSFVHPADAALLVRGPGGASRPHAHHFWHLVVGLERPLRAWVADEEWSRAAGVIVPADLPHAIETEGQVAILFVEPQSHAGLSLAARRDAGAPWVLSDEQASRAAAALERAGRVPDDALLGAILDVLGAPAPPPRRVHPGVDRTLRYLGDADPDADTSLDALAVIAGLSPGRLMHAFTEHVGVPLRAYVRWLRLRRAAAALLGGASATAAAHAAGFADAAHMTRTFAAMFGVTPRELVRRSQSVQSP